MNEATLRALHGSIEKWEKIVAKEGGDKGVMNCSLCERFCVDGCYAEENYFDDEEQERCPVAIAVNDSGCCSTPYSQWSDHQARAHASTKDEFYSTGYMVKCDVCEMLAKAELEFLKSLVPAA